MIEQEMSAEAEIRRRIAAQGPITFAEFMGMALYHTEGGYYTWGERIGASGDYYTSPAVHPAFGALLAVQLFQIWDLLVRPVPFTVVEAGAGNGLLCRDISAGASWLPDDFHQALRYVCIDQRTSAGLERGLPQVSRVASEGIPLRSVVGCVLSNELLDAMPVHQVRVEDGELREVYITLRGESLIAQTGRPSTPLLEQRFESLGVRLAEGQTAEVNLALDGWVSDASSTLDRGFVLTIDYGRTAEDLYSSSERFLGTLTTYRDHLQTDLPLERIGRQDMSAQVDFTALARAGRRAGLDFLGFHRQAVFLGNLGLDGLLQRSSGGAQRLDRSGAMAMRELVKPDGLGNFKVMAHGKGVARPDLWGFRRSMEAVDIVEGMPLPQPTAEHINLLAGRYPAMETEFDMPWDALWPEDAPPT